MKINKMELQKIIIEALKVSSSFNVEYELENRVDFLKNYLRSTSQKAFILGISGGIDSTLAGRLAQKAVEELRADAYPAYFIAVRLPYGTQSDEEDAQAAIDYIKPDQLLNINIKESSDAILNAMHKASHIFSSSAQQDFILGNIKARQRMVVQYALASSHQGLVIGTDHASEAVMGFFTKFGDGACDVAPLTGLTKGRVRELGLFMGVPSALVNKKPTADLETLAPQRLDEDVYGVTYTQIDAFLEGKPVADMIYEKIITAYFQSEHKRNLPITPYSSNSS
ncbi:ammonia-dependent NAD(+) synthetase [Legionella lytica]|uniref:NH(3)-dependent NAD(+) synthetase n=1 Tax=Legionella lytica TaxID=96232 RepID=A0ABW8DCP0_9GAMM